MYVVEASKIRHVDLLVTFKSCRGAGFHQQIASKQSARVYLATPWRICSCTKWQALLVAGRNRVVSVEPIIVGVVKIEEGCSACLQTLAFPGCT
jgi:hypothetical protein